ncbi:hypothetical protein ACWD0G_31630, partial [Streptomyces goshikiensis]
MAMEPRYTSPPDRAPRDPALSPTGARASYQSTRHPSHPLPGAADEPAEVGGSASYVQTPGFSSRPRGPRIGKGGYVLAGIDGKIKKVVAS